MKKKFIIIPIILFQFILHFINAQNDLKFNLIEGPNGKPLGKVNAITQDPHGYIWLCGSGERCLYRYDGIRMITFRHDDDNPNSLGLTNLETVYADDKGLIWIGGEGLDQYNPTTGNFTHFKHSQNDTESANGNYVYSILKDHLGRVWIGTGNGLDRLDEKSGKFIHYRSESGNPKSLSSNVIWRLYEDHEGILWIATGNPFFKRDPDDGGLNRLNEDGSFTRYMHDAKDPYSLINNKVAAVFEDSRGTFWVGTGGDGLHTMDRKTGQFTRLAYDPKNPEALSRPPLKPREDNDKINFITEDCTGSIWIGTEYSGMNRYDTLTKKITHYEQSNGFPDGTAWNAFSSRDGVLWITTEQDNVYRVDPFHQSLKSIPTVAPVTSFLEDKDGYLWVGTLGNGLLKYDAQKKIVQQYKTLSDPLSHITNTAISLFQNVEESIWVGTIDGLRILDKKTNQFLKFKENKIVKDSPEVGVTRIYQDKKGTMWFSRYGDGLIQYNPKDSSFKHFLSNAEDSTSISSNLILSFLEDRSGVFWVGGLFGGGINRLNQEQNTFKHYLTGTSTFSIYEDSRNNLWAGTENGLYRYDPDKDQFLAFIDPLSEISSYVIDGMIEDSSHNLWIKSSSAFIKLNPLTKETFIYSTNVGITRASMTWLRFYATHGKQILLGHDKGFYQIHPDSLAIKTNFKLMLTELFINTIAILPGVGSQIKKPVEEINDLVLKYNENNINLNFTAVDYREPETIKYFFKLEGYDREWQEVRDKKDKSSYYFNLPPGAYTYKLKAFNNDGTKAEKTLKIHIYPPWWRTWWAYSIYILLLVGGIWTYVNRRTHTLEKEKIVLEQKVMERTRELKDEKEIVESTLLKLKATQTQLIHSEKMASLGELTAGIAHEIQNPLNFVNNFSEINSELAEEAGDEMDKGNYSEGKNILKLIKENERKINHHGKRADAIVKAMLQHSQTSTSQEELTDINKLAGEYLHLAYEDLKIKGFQDNANKTLSGGEPEKAIATTLIPITIGTDFDPEIGSILVIPKDMVRVLLNLYSNAFYAVQSKALKNITDSHESTITPNKYEPTITLMTKKEGDKVLISVKDNGEGTPEKIIDKIFQPFFTTKPAGQGTGLGLSLAYDIIKAHGGTISVKTNYCPPGGTIKMVSNHDVNRTENERAATYTEFIIHLPVNH